MEQQISIKCRKDGNSIIIVLPKKYVTDVLGINAGDIIDLKILGIRKPEVRK